MQMRTICGTILAAAVCGSPCEAMMRGARESGGFYGVTMLSDGKRARKSSAFRVIRPLLACARAPIMTSATGRRATLPDRLRWTCLFHAETAMERSSSLTPGGRSIPISNRKFRSRASSPRKAGASSKFFHPLCGGTRLPKSRGVSKHCLGAFTLRLLHACHQCFHVVYNTSCRSSCQGGKLVKKRKETKG